MFFGEGPLRRYPRKMPPRHGFGMCGKRSMSLIACADAVPFVADALCAEEALSLYLCCTTCAIHMGQPSIWLRYLQDPLCVLVLKLIGADLRFFHPCKFKSVVAALCTTGWTCDHDTLIRLVVDRRMTDSIQANWWRCVVARWNAANTLIWTVVNEGDFPRVIGYHGDGATHTIIVIET